MAIRTTTGFAAVDVVSGQIAFCIVGPVQLQNPDEVHRHSHCESPRCSGRGGVADWRLFPTLQLDRVNRFPIVHHLIGVDSNLQGIHEEAGLRPRDFEIHRRAGQTGIRAGPDRVQGVGPGFPDLDAGDESVAVRLADHRTGSQHGRGVTEGQVLDSVAVRGRGFPGGLNIAVLERIRRTEGLDGLPGAGIERVVPLRAEIDHGGGPLVDQLRLVVAHAQRVVPVEKPGGHGRDRDRLLPVREAIVDAADYKSGRGRIGRDSHCRGDGGLGCIAAGQSHTQRRPEIGVQARDRGGRAAAIFANLRSANRDGQPRIGRNVRQGQIRLDETVARVEVEPRDVHVDGGTFQRRIDVRRGEGRIELKHQRGHGSRVRGGGRGAIEVWIAVAVGIVPLREKRGVRTVGRHDLGFLANLRSRQPVAGRVKEDRRAAGRRE